MGYDWNKNGKIDSFDRYIDYELSTSNFEERSNSTSEHSSPKYNRITDKNVVSTENYDSKNNETKNSKDAQISPFIWMITILVYIILSILVIKFLFY